MYKIIRRIIPPMILLLVLSGCITTAFTDEPVAMDKVAVEGAVFASFIPEGWTVLRSVEADFNNDSLIDIAVVLEKTDDEDSQFPRSLIILFRNSFNLYTLSVQTDTAVMRADEGGIWGDPFEDLTVSGSDLILDFYGGSNWRWYNSYTFTYLEGLWSLAEARLGYYFSATTMIEEADEDYYNFLECFYTGRKKNEAGDLNLTEKEMINKELIALEDFIVNSTESTFDTNYLIR